MPASTESLESLDADVIVVGAGPVGLLLGAELALGGASVALLERAARPSTTIKAGSINLASAEILARRGVLPAARELSQARVAPLLEQVLGDATPAGNRDRARETARQRLSRAGHFAGIWIDGDLVDPHDPDVAAHSEALGATMIAQQEIESLLAEHAARLGVRPRRGVVVRDVHDDGDHVRVGTSEGELRARWLVGCDGGRSVVRHAAGFAFPGSDPEITGRQAVVELDDPGALAIGWHWTPRGVWRHGPAAGTILTVEFDGPPADGRRR